MSVKKRKLVILDTNIIVSGFLDGDNISYPSRVISAWLVGDLQVAVSKELKKELNQVLKKPYINRILEDQKSIKPILGRLFNKAVMIYPESINEVSFPDEKDHFLLELAVTAKSEIIVTGDKELLNVKKVRNIQILNPKQFCQQFKIDDYK